MPTESLVDQLNSIVDLVQLDRPPVNEQESYAAYMGNPEYPAITLMGENLKNFDSNVNRLLRSLTPLKGTVSHRFIVDELIPILQKKKAAGESFNLSDADDFWRKICASPLRQYKVYGRIRGVDIAAGKAPIRLGEFVIDFEKNVFAAGRINPLSSTVGEPGGRDQLCIRCDIEGRDRYFAAKLADELFYRFELIFRFLIGVRTDHIEVGILNYSGVHVHMVSVHSDDGPGLSSSREHGAVQPFILGDPRFPDPTPSIAKLFGLITRANNDLEKHILRCAEWTGQALHEPNEAAALVKAAIALEVLFRTDEKSVITSSIMAQISENCAFLLGAENGSPLEIEREVKRLYGVRSSVVHSGKDSVDSKDLESFIDICRRAVIRLLSDDEFRGIDSASKLAEHFRSKRYASITSIQTTL